MKAYAIICADTLSEACEYADSNEHDFRVTVEILSELQRPPVGIMGSAYVDVTVEGPSENVTAALRDAWGMTDEEIMEAIAE